MTGTASSSSDYALQCTREQRTPTGRESVTAWLYTPAVLAFITGVVAAGSVSLLTFFLWTRNLRTRARAAASDAHEHSTHSSGAGTVEERQEGFRECAVGGVHKALLWAVSVVLLLLQALLVPQVEGTKLTCATEELQRRRLTLFICSGVFTTAWFGALSLCWPVVGNALRVPCDLAHADVVQVTIVTRQALAGATSEPHVHTLSCPVARAGAGVQADGTCADAAITVLGERRVYSAQHRRFVAPACEWHAPHVGAVQGHVSRGGLTKEQARDAFAKVGPNLIHIPMPSLWAALSAEFVQGFYVYQFACVSLWAVDAYVSYAYVLGASICMAGVANVLLLRRTQRQLRALARHVCVVRVCRDGRWDTVPSTQLVPGDVVALDAGLLPCDLVLAAGRPVVDESSLTGESLPVTKAPLPPACGGGGGESPLLDVGRHKRHCLFAGTRVLKPQDGPGERSASVGVVISTGVATSQGQLLRSMLFPQPLRLGYEPQVRVILGALVLLGCVAAGMTLFDYRSASAATAIVFALESLATVIPPLLPLALAVGQAVASDRLRRKDVHCLALPRIALAGMVDLCCFDKTGTLTKDGLEWTGALPVVAVARAGQRVRFADRHQGDAAALPGLTTCAMAACTSLSLLGDQLVGNEVDRQLFTATRWRLLEAVQGVGTSSLPGMCSPTGEQQLTVLRRFEFDHGLQCMSAVVQDQRGEYHVFVKGSPERVQQLCVPDSVPPDFDSTVATLAKQGAYVLALGHRNSCEQEARAVAHGALERGRVEQALQLLCLLILRNELKDDTPQALAALHAGGIPSVMITGDNAFTGARVARDCGLLRRQAAIALADGPATDTGALLSWRDLDTGAPVDEAALLAQLNGLRGAAPGGEAYELALSGDAFAVAFASAAQAACGRGDSDARTLLLHTRIFARMSPEQKAACVELFKSQGVVTAMVGDGGNDCGALRAAHCGVALSSAEASLVAPFASKRHSLSAVVDVMLEGRASLATGFASLKYMCMYGLLYSVLNLCVNAFQGSLSSGMYLLVDIGIIMPLSTLSTLGHPARALTRRKPPTNLLGPANLLSLLGQLVLCTACVAAALGLLRMQPDYSPQATYLEDASRWWNAPDRIEVTVVFLSCLFAFATSAVAFSMGSTFRAAAWRNWQQDIVFGALLLLFTALTLGGAGPMARALHLVPLPRALRFQLCALLLGQSAAMLALEKLLLDGPLATACWASWDRVRGAARPSFLRLATQDAAADNAPFANGHGAVALATITMHGRDTGEPVTEDSVRLLDAVA